MFQSLIREISANVQVVKIGKVSKILKAFICYIRAIQVQLLQ